MSDEQRGELTLGGLHHVELWVPSLERAIASWGWLLGELGYQLFQQWDEGRSWRREATYIVLEQSPDLAPGGHDRVRPGLNHLAFHAGSRRSVDVLTQGALKHGWSLLFEQEHPYAGGSAHYAAYLADADGYEVELVAADPER